MVITDKWGDTVQDWKSRITIDPKVCHGRPCIKGTRVWVSLIVDNLAAGFTEEEIIEAYPFLTKDDIRAALAFAAEMARERFVDLPLKIA
ncbi:MAG: DUF433 domain-containing protein [Chloroflexi bacterium]|nr:DUF433 domain-containing protein [Chloroflexota bacterium]